MWRDTLRCKSDCTPKVGKSLFHLSVGGSMNHSVLISVNMPMDSNLFLPV